MKKCKYLPNHDEAETILLVMWLVLMIVYNKMPEQMPLNWMSICAVSAIYLAIPVMIEFIALVRRGFSWRILWLAWLLLAVIAFFTVFCIRTFNLIISIL